MNERIISKVNEGIMDTKVNLTYKEFVDLLKEIQDKDEKIKEKDEEIDYLCTVIDALEEEKEEYYNEDEEDDWLDEWPEDNESESERLREELKEVEKLAEDRADLFIKAVNRIIAKNKLIEELREENRKLLFGFGGII